ncbi:SLC26A/SulP transporter family protein [Candidatus Contubernalis alkaliaceticus]|uniref:SLC26A/SulP transporter family protein n=1 Tax=Candidatus Contubernalis alkaliaceticus TaxID=338645 RepID=UPI001F4C31A7|nr:SulP family inorganic anion transporter [Candidatus Contubernalis alkalaceticus]UNC93141.1 SLC26A/SulP transporter family protein [Candidatus Contubernalis alkalaceticus]
MSHLDTVFREILSDLRSPKCLQGISIGLIVGLMLVVYQVSFASMIFSGPLEVHISRGIGMALAGTLVITMVTALFSNIRSLVAMPQDAPVVLLAVVAAGIAASIGETEGTAVFITITAALICSCLISGIFFYFIGHFQLAELFRFMPYPVVSGFLAGTGWLLTKGSLEVMTGTPLTLDSIVQLTSTISIALWLPGAAYALTLFLILRRYSHYFILPGSLIAAIFLYYTALWLTGISISEAQYHGALFDSFAAGSLWPAFSLQDFQQVEWPLILKQLPAIAVIPFISMIGLLLNTGSFELASKKEIDMNRELMVSGAANTLMGMTGTYPGFTALGLSMLGLKIGADTRLVGLTAALMLGGTLLLGSRLLAFFPKALLGGLLMLMGLIFLFDWLVDTRKKMPYSDYLMIWAIFLIIIVFGYLYGVLFGLLTTMILFVIRFSRIPLLRSVSSGSLVHSMKGRSIPHQRLLAMHGERTTIYELEGYIFFGSVTTLINGISSTVKNPARVPVDVIILNFKKVSGFDISSVNNFVRLLNRYSQSDLLFAFAETPHGFNELLTKNLDEQVSRSLKFFPDLESALQWAEDRILEQQQQVLSSFSKGCKTARDNLFESISDELLRSLDLQAHVEELLERLGKYLTDENYSKEEVVLSKSQAAQGLYLVKGGVVAEVKEVGNNRSTHIRDLGSGTVFAEMAPYGQWPSPFSYLAKTDVQLSILTPDALKRLETDAPALALEVHRIVIQNFCILKN